MPDQWKVPWQTVSTRQVYENPWLSLREDQVRLPDGRTTVYGVVTCGDCVGILPFLDDSTVVLVRQYRYVARRVTWEMPTGGVRPGETIEDAAHRELAEEAGFQASSLEPLVSFNTSKSVVDETAHLFLARGLSRNEPVPGDDTEFLDVQTVPFARARTMVLDGTITDSMTIMAVLLAGARNDSPVP